MICTLRYNDFTIKRFSSIGKAINQLPKKGNGVARAYVVTKREPVKYCTCISVGELAVETEAHM